MSEMQVAKIIRFIEYYIEFLQEGRDLISVCINSIWSFKMKLNHIPYLYFSLINMNKTVFLSSETHGFTLKMQFLTSQGKLSKFKEELME